jgi:hypothetical protein
MPPPSQGGGGFGGLTLGGMTAVVPTINMNAQNGFPNAMFGAGAGGGMMHDQGGIVGNNQGFTNPLLPMTPAQFAHVTPTKVLHPLKPLSDTSYSYQCHDATILGVEVVEYGDPR